VTVLGCKACCAKHKCTYLLTNRNSYALYRIALFSVTLSKTLLLLTTPFFPRNAMLAQYMLPSCVNPSIHLSVCPNGAPNRDSSVRLSYASVVPEQLNVRSRKQRVQ